MCIVRHPPEEAKGPVHEDIVAGGEGNADADEEQVGHRQVQDQHVRGVLHLRICMNLQTSNQEKVFFSYWQKVFQYSILTF